MTKDIIEISKKVGIRTLGKVNGITLFNDVTYEKINKLVDVTLDEIEKLVQERISHSDADGEFQDGKNSGLAEALEVIRTYREEITITDILDK